jgi:hypothetical protein
MVCLGPTIDYPHDFVRAAVRNHFFSGRGFCLKDPRVDSGGGDQVPALTKRGIPRDGGQVLQEPQKSSAYDQSEAGLGEGMYSRLHVFAAFG